MKVTSHLRKTANNISPRAWFISLLVCLVVVVAGAVILNEYKVAQQHAETDDEWSLIARPITLEDHTIGTIGAPVQLIVYSDFECTYCKALFKTDIPKLQAQFPNQLVVAYRHRVLVSDPSSKIEEEASECVAQAGGNDAFWKFAESMFDQSSSVDKKDSTVLAAFATQAGADPQTYAACMKAGAGAPEVDKDNLEASIAGITQDPSILLKSAHRALIVSGEYYSQLYTGITYLLETNSQINGR